MAINSEYTFIYYTLVTLIVAVGTLEYFLMHKDKLKSGYFVLTMFFAIFFPAYFYFPALWTKISMETIFVLIIVLYSLRMILNKNEPSVKLERLKSSLVPLFLVAFCFSYQVNLRMFNGGGETAKEILFYYFAVMILSDSSAYFIGSTLGKHKLAPSSSPKKTIEGSIAAVVGSVLAAIISYYLFLDYFTLTGAIIGSVILSLLGQAGDLIESIIKRTVEVKDSSSLLMGHGGVLDRIDSFTITSPIFYLILNLLKQV